MLCLETDTALAVYLAAHSKSDIGRHPVLCWCTLDRDSYRGSAQESILDEPGAITSVNCRTSQRDANDHAW